MVVDDDAPLDSTWWKQEKRTEDIESIDLKDVVGSDPEEDEEDMDLNPVEEDDLEIENEPGDSEDECTLKVQISTFTNLDIISCKHSGVSLR